LESYTLYHETHDKVSVKELLGHRSIDTTLLYIQLDKTLFNENSEEFIAKMTKEPSEVQTLLEVGFLWVGVTDGLVYLRKRK